MVVTVAVSLTVTVPVTVVLSCAAVTVTTFAPTQEHALEYLTEPEQADAYVGIPPPPLPPRGFCRPRIAARPSTRFRRGRAIRLRSLSLSVSGETVTVATVWVAVAVAVNVLWWLGGRDQY